MQSSVSIFKLLKTVFFSIGGHPFVGIGTGLAALSFAAGNAIGTTAPLGTNFGTGQPTVASTEIEVSSGLAYAWCDDNQLYVRTRHKLFLLDAKTFERRPIEISEKGGEQLSVPTPMRGACAEAGVLAFKTSPLSGTGSGGQRVNVYVGPTSGGEAAPLARLSDKFLGARLSKNYIIARRPRIPVEEGYKALEECGSVSRSDLRLLCVNGDVYDGRFFALQRFILAPYRWNDVVVLPDSRGIPHGFKNQSPPKLDPARVAIRSSLELRDLNFNFVADILEDKTFKIDQLHIDVDPLERFAYAPCLRRTESGSEASLDYYSVCRYLLDGKKNVWEQVFSSEELRTKARAHIKAIDIDRLGNIYFAPLGRPPYNGIWMYDSRSGKVSRLTQEKGRNGDDRPKVSPDGGSVAFVRTADKSVLYILRWRLR